MIKRFIGYSIIGTTAFALDLSLIYFFRDIALLPYWVAVPVAFLISTSLHYVVARHLVFSDTTRPLGEGYGYFILIMVVNALLVTGLVALLVEYGHTSVYLARILVAGLVGILSFFLNTKYNFKVS